MKTLPPRVVALTPRLTMGLILFAVGLTTLLAYRAFEASRAQRQVAEQTLREYAGFAAFELKTATVARFTGQHRQALDPVVRWITTRGPTPAMGAARVAALVMDQGALCRCLDGISFFYQVSFADSTVEASGIDGHPSPLATAEHLRRLRDTVLVQAQGPSRAAPAFPNFPGRSIGVPLTAQYLVTIFSTLDARPYVFTHAVTVDTSGTPIVAYGFAVPAELPVGRAVALVLQQQPVLPTTLTRGLRVDSLLAVTVTTSTGTPIHANQPRIDGRYEAHDSLETRMGGLRFAVAIDPSAAGRLLIGGLPRSRLPEVLATTFLAVGLLGLLLHQFRRQEELGRLRDEFVSGVSHELRTPLAQIRLLAELLRLGKVPTDEQRERSLRIIDKEARRLSFLVDGILSFTRTQRTAMAFMRTDVATEVEEIVAGFAPLAEAEGVRIDTQLARDLVVDVDRGALRQVLLNLLDNAVRYGPAGQTVRITTASTGTSWTLEVADAGRGIPADERERIFAPYYRLSRDEGGAAGGTGIGLSVVRRLVAAHGGAVHVAANAEGEHGARFVVTLPKAPVGGQPT